MFNETEFTAFALPFFVKALGLSEDDVKDKSMTPEGQKELATLYGDQKKAARTEGHKEAEGKLQKKLNKAGKDLFGVEIEGDTAKDFDAALTAIKDGFKPEGGEVIPPAEMTEKQVKQHPLFILTEKAKSDAEKALNDTKAEFDQKLNEQVGRKTATLSMQQTAQAALTDLRAKLPTHEGQKKLALAEFQRSFEGIEGKQVGDTTYYFDKDGNRLEDAMGTPLQWDALVRQKAEALFEMEGPDRQSPGEKPAGAGTPATPGAVQVNLQPRTLGDLSKIITTPGVTREQKEIAKSFYHTNATDA